MKMYARRHRSRWRATRCGERSIACETITCPRTCPRSLFKCCLFVQFWNHRPYGILLALHSPPNPSIILATSIFGLYTQELGACFLVRALSMTGVATHCPFRNRKQNAGRLTLQPRAIKGRGRKWHLVPHPFLPLIFSSFAAPFASLPPFA